MSAKIMAIAIIFLAIGSMVTTVRLNRLQNYTEQEVYYLREQIRRMLEERR